MTALLFVWSWLKRVPFQVWLGLGLLIAVWWWHTSAVNRAVDEATAACNAEHERAAKDDHDAKEASIAQEAVPANQQTRKTLDGIAGEVRKLREAKTTPSVNAGCMASPETVGEVNAYR